MTNNKKPLLWEEGMTYEDFKIRQAFYNGTAQPRSTPISRPPDGAEVMDVFNYPLFDEYEESFQDIAYAIYYMESGTYASCSEELFNYSLYGLESIDI